MKEQRSRLHSRRLSGRSCWAIGIAMLAVLVLACNLWAARLGTRIEFSQDADTAEIRLTLNRQEKSPYCISPYCVLRYWKKARLHDRFQFGVSDGCPVVVGEPEVEREHDP